MALFNFLKQKQNRTMNLAGGQAYTETPQM